MDVPCSRRARRLGVSWHARERGWLLRAAAQARVAGCCALQCKQRQARCPHPPRRTRTAMVMRRQSSPLPSPRAAEVTVPGATMSGFTRPSVVGPAGRGRAGGAQPGRRAAQGEGPRKTASRQRNPAQRSTAQPKSAAQPCPLAPSPDAHPGSSSWPGFQSCWRAAPPPQTTASPPFARRPGRPGPGRCGGSPT